jgi:hypothetical protein
MAPVVNLRLTHILRVGSFCHSSIAPHSHTVSCLTHSLSHTWATAQPDVHLMKARLARLVPQMKVFLGKLHAESNPALHRFPSICDVAEPRAAL